MIETAPWLALAFLATAFAAGLGAMLARALFVTCMYLVVCGALAAGAMALLGNGGAALVVALLFAGMAPIMLLALALLGSRTTKTQRRARPWLSMSAAFAVALALLWATPELGVGGQRLEEGQDALGAWLAPLVFVTASAFIALLGFGERGALQRSQSADTAP